jgi:hypothetical protein
MPALWAVIDTGKAHHHCVLFDDEGNRLLWRKVANDEAALTELLTEILALAAVRDALGYRFKPWRCRAPDRPARSLRTIPDPHSKVIRLPRGPHLSGRWKTDARDPAIITDQARMRRDLQPIRSGDQICTDLRLLISRRIDLVCDRTRASNRLCAVLA